MKLTIVASMLVLVAPIAAGPAAQTPNNFFDLEKRASLPVPSSKGSVTYKSPKAVSGTFDGGFKTYGRGVSCTGQKEGGDSDAVFILENGATLKNAIIGKDQIEGVHCKGSCTIENVWWVDVCEGKSYSAVREVERVPQTNPHLFPQTLSPSRATATPSSRAAAPSPPTTR